MRPGIDGTVVKLVYYESRKRGLKRRRVKSGSEHEDLDVGID